MHRTTAHHRLPRAGVDVIDDATSALAMISATIHRPMRPETILLLLDEARRGRSIVVVTGTVDPDAVVEIVECITQGVDADELGAIVIASVRPSVAAGGDRATESGDVDRWLEMSDIASAAGVELLEWFVIGRGVSCPRDRLGEPPRW
jgi:hypothetical protein